MENEKSGGSKFAINKVLGSTFESSDVKKGIIISFGALLVIYLGMSLFFINHFYIGSKVNGISISGKTVKQADELVTSQTDSYVLKLNERGDKQEQISAADIELKSDSSSKLQELKDDQNPFAWILAPFQKRNTELTGIITFDEDKLNKVLDKLNCNTSKDIVKPENAKLNYTEGGYEITNEVIGNQVNKDSLFNAVKTAILNDKSELDLDESNCYEKPKFTANSQEVADAKNEANKYLVSNITYTFGNKNEVLDKSTIHNWITVNNNFEVVFDESKVKDYVYTLNSKYGTAGKQRDFKTSSNQIKKVGGMIPGTDSGEYYGWSINISQETKDLIDNIKNGQSVTKEPIYSRKAYSHEANDIGNTYVEVDLTNQHLWFYKNGSLVVEGNVVTGNLAGNNTATPPGVYKIKYKEKDSTLKGDNGDGKKYETPVKYWMPFNAGIGIHDAWWRQPGDFNKATYKTNGSHGCVNCPTELAGKIFDNIETGTPVVVYY